MPEEENENVEDYVSADIELKKAELTWMWNNRKRTVEGPGEKVGTYPTVYHQTHASEKGKSIWWIVEGGKMKVVGIASHVGSKNGEYSFERKAKGMPQRYKRK
nr:hypothetical protein [Nostoc sp. ChiSLP03a]MDZ8210240.1 hypothetical protein [Nostoc sp. ChiSLP03a]